MLQLIPDEATVQLKELAKNDASLFLMLFALIQHIYSSISISMHCLSPIVDRVTVLIKSFYCFGLGLNTSLFAKIKHCPLDSMIKQSDGASLL